MWEAYTVWLKSNGHYYKPAKSDKKLKHGIEKIQPKKDNKSVIQEVGADAKDKSFFTRFKEQAFQLFSSENDDQKKNKKRLNKLWNGYTDYFTIIMLILLLYLIFTQYQTQK